MKSLSIEQLAEKLGGNLWIKEDKKRIYLDRGYNTKKMSTKTYVYQREDGTFGVSCYIDCPSQDYNWIKSQQNKVIKNVEDDIEDAMATEIFLVVNEKGNVINENGEEKALNDLYSSDYFLNNEKAEKALEDFPADYSFTVMNRDEFNAEVERLEEIERNLPLKTKFERGDEIRFSKDRIETLKIKIEEEGIAEIITIGKIYNDLSGHFRLRKEGELAAFDIYNEKKAEFEKPYVPVYASQLKTNPEPIKEIIILENADRVSHTKFGQGTVISEDDKIIEISFDDASIGVKKLLKKYAPLTKVESND